MPVRYVIDTHSHADHAWGNCFFPGATVIGHPLCRQLLDTKGRASLEETRRSNPSFRNVKIVLPHMTFNDGEMNLRVGKKDSHACSRLPGHSPDNLGVLVEEDRVLFAGDAAMPLPYIVDGDIDELTPRSKKLLAWGWKTSSRGMAISSCAARSTTSSRITWPIFPISAKLCARRSKRKYPRKCWMRPPLKAAERAGC